VKYKHPLMGFMRSGSGYPYIDTGGGWRYVVSSIKSFTTGIAGGLRKPP
jgi:hypothetical protein